MDTSLLKRCHSVDEAECQKDSDSDGGTLSKIVSSTEKVRELKLKELPLVHRTKKKSESGNTFKSTNPDDLWLIGGSLGSRNAVLRFRCSALSDPPIDPPANELHMTYKTIQAETKLLSAVLHSHGMREVHPNIPDFNLLWTGIHPKPHLLKAMTPYQRVNHFPRSYELTRKDRLYKNIEKMQHIKGVKHFDFIPQTFMMPMDFRELCSSHYRHRGPWIVKPVASSRGRGIYIVNSPDQVPLDETLIVAKYIDNPLLVDGHKCDLRLYVAVTSYDPLVVYMYEEGLVRFATVKYDSSGKHLWNPCMHLCNYSINKYHSDYIKSEDPDAEDVGHKWTLSALLRHLRAQGIDTAFLMQRIEEVVVKAILASAPPIVSACRMFVPHPRNCFELYGFDILIDSSLKPWLLEVNLSPSLGCDSPLDVRVKSAMLADLLTLIGLPTTDPMLRRAKEIHRPQNQLDILKKISCRRVQSADALSGSSSSILTKPPSLVAPSRLIASSLSLSPEENRIIKSVRAEFERRGGFVRLFPSAESWKRYGCFLDPVTGITCTSVVPGGQLCVPPMVVAHNYNLLIHQQLFPELQAVCKAMAGSPLPDRLTRYERALLQGHKASLDERHLDRTGFHHSVDESALFWDIMQRNIPEERRSHVTVNYCEHEETAESVQTEERNERTELKNEVVQSMENGSRLSQYQARRAFAQYLICILRRISGQNKTDSIIDDHGDLILRFLQKASSNLRTPYFVQIPSRKLVGKDRVAVVAKQLNDFIYLYNRETDLYSEGGDKPNVVPSKLYQRFLSEANEEDLEEVLSLQTRLYKCAHLYLGRSGSNPNSVRPFGLLHSLPYTPGGRDKLGCECSRSHHQKTLPRLSKSGLAGGVSAMTQQSSNFPSTATDTGKRQSLKMSRAL